MRCFTNLNSRFCSLKYPYRVEISWDSSSINSSPLITVSFSSWTWKWTKILKWIKSCTNSRISHWMAPIKKFLCKWNNITSYTYKIPMLIFPISKIINSLHDKIIVSLICPHNLINKILIREQIPHFTNQMFICIKIFRIRPKP